MKNEAAPRVLFVEDEAIMALVATRAMQARGYAVDHASTAEEALELFACGDYELVVTDIELGAGMDGIEAAKRILRGSQVPLLFYTGQDRADVDDRAAELGGYYYYLRKSADATVLLETMEFCLKRDGKRRLFDDIEARPAAEAEGDSIQRQRLDLRLFLRDYAESGKRQARR